MVSPTQAAWLNRQRRRRRLARVLDVLPLHSRLAWGGDSITAIEGITGYVSWMTVLCPQYLTISTNNFAVAGYTTQDFIDNRLTNMVNHGAMMNVFMCGTNDIPARITAGDTEAQAIEYTTSRLRTIYDALLTSAEGAKVLAVCILPRTAGTWTATHEAVRDGVNAWIQAQPDIEFCEIETIVAADLKDNVHPNDIGAREVGAVVAAKLATLIDDTDIYEALAADGSVNLIANPNMDGENAITEGVLASNWTLTVAAGGVNRVVASKGTLASGHAAQVFTLSGVPSSQALVTFQSDTFNVGGVSGERYEAFMAYELAGVSSVITQRLFHSGSTLGQWGSGTSDADVLSLATIAGVIRTKPVTLSGAAASAALNFTMLLNTSTLAGTIKLGRPFVRRAP